MPRQPVVVTAYFAAGPPQDHPGLHALVNAIKQAGIPAATPKYVGTYGANQSTADAVTALPAGVYAPLFSIQPAKTGGPYAGRHLPQRDLDKLDPRYGGAIPLRTPGEPLPRSDYLKWGVELGCRFRDSLRHSGQGGKPIATTWQLDEILDQVIAGPLAGPYRLFTAGILQGLRHGRPQLGDGGQTGLVWAAGETLDTLPVQPTPTGSPLALLWDAIDNAGRFYIGEEYVAFDGDPQQAAQSWSSGQRRMLHAGPTRQRIAHKYVVGMTPGFVRSPNLRGNIHGWPLSRVNAWRDRFVQARAELAPVSGFAQFNFTGANARSDVMLAAIEATVLPV
jgi:hypothetical protein